MKSKELLDKLEKTLTEQIKCKISTSRIELSSSCYTFVDLVLYANLLDDDSVQNSHNFINFINECYKVKEKVCKDHEIPNLPYEI